MHLAVGLLPRYHLTGGSIAAISHTARGRPEFVLYLSSQCTAVQRVNADTVASSAGKVIYRAVGSLLCRPASNVPPFHIPVISSSGRAHQSIKYQPKLSLYTHLSTCSPLAVTFRGMWWTTKRSPLFRLTSTTRVCSLAARNRPEHS